MPSAEPVGTLAEEAAKLLAVFQARASGADDHVDDAGDLCDGCPLCRLRTAVRAVSPEVRQHLSEAATSVVLAMKGLLDDPGAANRRAAPFEKIDLTEE